MSEVKSRKIKNIFVVGAVTPDRIAESIRKHSTKHDIGAHEIFLGQVRGDLVSKTASGNVDQQLAEGSTRVSSITYTAYEEMALEAMHDIREDTFTRFPITCMHVYHSLGDIKVGDICFFVFASSTHRQAAREAVAHLVDTIKEKLPIFAKENFDDGDHQWKENK